MWVVFNYNVYVTRYLRSPFVGQLCFVLNSVTHLKSVSIGIFDNFTMSLSR